MPTLRRQGESLVWLRVFSYARQEVKATASATVSFKDRGSRCRELFHFQGSRCNPDRGLVCCIRSAHTPGVPQLALPKDLVGRSGGRGGNRSRMDSRRGFESIQPSCRASDASCCGVVVSYPRMITTCPDPDSRLTRGHGRTGAHDGNRGSDEGSPSISRPFPAHQRATSTDDQGRVKHGTP